MRVPYFPQAVILYLPNGRDYGEDLAQFLGHLTLPVMGIRVVSHEEIIKITNPVAYFVGEEQEPAVAGE
jgi:hypothetical protein